MRSVIHPADKHVLAATPSLHKVAAGCVLAPAATQLYAATRVLVTSWLSCCNRNCANAHAGWMLCVHCMCIGSAAASLPAQRYLQKPATVAMVHLLLLVHSRTQQTGQLQSCCCALLALTSHSTV